MGIMIGSPPLVWGLILWFILVTAYSIDLPFLRWKRNAFLAAISIMIGYGVGIQFSFFIHIQKYVLGRSVVITRSLIFTTGVITCMSLAKALLKDLHDVDGDKEYGIRTFSVMLGKERKLQGIKVSCMWHTRMRQIGLNRRLGLLKEKNGAFNTP
ncbi:hypothetical protein CUMW_155160 [Citrus unshiu]|uniref:Uncharacterized protein n=1 Tax=Citrus unshiu TaxID=55188 RepID=A0A2H5PPF4_CITUN|nr:hypothetical protein CUMW_155160 [Citrus unshiu]